MLTVSRMRVGDTLLELTHAKVAPGTGGLGEPLNVILSGHSDETVLVDREEEGGFRNYWL